MLFACTFDWRKSLQIDLGCLHVADNGLPWRSGIFLRWLFSRANDVIEFSMLVITTLLSRRKRRSINAKPVPFDLRGTSFPATTRKFGAKDFLRLKWLKQLIAIRVPFCAYELAVSSERRGKARACALFNNNWLSSWAKLRLRIELCCD